MIGGKDSRLKKNQDKAAQQVKVAKDGPEPARHVPQLASSMWGAHNEALVPPYNVLVDTNFLSLTVNRKLPLLESMMDCVYAKCTLMITSCVMAELEKLGPKYRIALRIARDERWERLECHHKGTYADDCIVDRVRKSPVYIVATNDYELRKRIKNIPGVPIMKVARGKYVIENLASAPVTK
jgi:U3 small nucleolar RNA-associated protein 24